MQVVLTDYLIFPDEHSKSESRCNGTMPHPGDALWIQLRQLSRARKHFNCRRADDVPTLFLTKMQMGHIFSSFLIGYAIFRFLPGLGDIKGPRFTLAAAGLFWWDCDGIHGT